MQVHSSEVLRACFDQRSQLGWMLLVSRGGFVLIRTNETMSDQAELVMCEIIWELYGMCEV